MAGLSRVPSSHQANYRSVPARLHREMNMEFPTEVAEETGGGYGGNGFTNGETG